MSDLAKFYVYVMFRPWNGIPCYVGKGSGRRAHKPSRKLNPHLASIIKKAGGPLPTVILRRFENEQDAYDTEITLIKAIGRGKNGPLANLTDGGEGTSGLAISEEYRAALSIRTRGNSYAKGRKQSPEEIENRRLSLMGKKRSPEAKERMSAYFFAPGNKIGLGTKRSDVSRKKISDAMKGKPLSEEHKKKLSDAKKGNQNRLGKFHSPETRAKISASKRRNSLANQLPLPLEIWHGIPNHGSGNSGLNYDSNVIPHKIDHPAVIADAI